MGTLDPLTSLGLSRQTPASTPASRGSLGQNDFLRLMTTQLQHQDPFKPMESGEFLGQIAQFSTVSGIESLNSSFAGLASSLQSNQALQASSLVGHGVLVPSDETYLQDGNNVYGAVDLAASGNAVVEITDASGQTVRTMDLGLQPAGLAHFGWDGRDDSGVALPEGRYGLRARSVNGSSTQAESTLIIGLVNSVSLSPGGLTLNLLGMDSAAFSEVREIV